MINEDKENHEEANEERYFSGYSSDVGGIIRSHFKCYSFRFKWYVVWFILKIEIEVNLAIYLVSQLQQGCQLISLSISFDSEHDVISCIA